ncbi:hypothetical protein Barb4_02526 [Bacteroidales bacterium Barb4]|nr:hypothetical protein Barb4_02526 [Bacteroidales bacterium Barb4]
MKKVFFLIVALLIITNTDAQVSFSAKVIGGLPGYIGDVDETFSDRDAETKFKVGFKIGAGVNYAFSNNFSLQSGLFFSQKGAKYEGEEEGQRDGDPAVPIAVTYNPLYLEIPVLAAYKFQMTDQVKLSLSAGPYLAYGLGGKAKQEETYGDIKLSVDANLFSKTKRSDENINALLKRFDAGLAFGAEAEIGKILVSLNYDLGLYNIYTNKTNDKDDNNKYSLKNSGLWLGVGHKF